MSIRVLARHVSDEDAREQTEAQQERERLWMQVWSLRSKHLQFSCLTRLPYACLYRYNMEIAKL